MYGQCARQLVEGCFADYSVTILAYGANWMLCCFADYIATVFAHGRMDVALNPDVILVPAAGLHL